MTIRTRIERLECLHGDTAEPIHMVDWPVEDELTVQEWLAFCHAIDAEQERQKI